MSVHLWIAAADPVGAAQLRASESLLSPDERARANRFHFAHDRDRFVVAHGLTRAALAEASGCDPRDVCFETGRYGRPFVVRPDAVIPISFSISHTSGQVGVALSDRGPIGLDIESLERRIEPLELGRRTMTGAELSVLQRLDGRALTEAFLRLWTLKESYIKAIGTGFSTDPTSFSFDLTQPAPLFNPPTDDTRAWDFHLLTPSPVHVASVCYPAPREALHLHDGCQLLSTLSETGR